MDGENSNRNRDQTTTADGRMALARKSAFVTAIGLGVLALVLLVWEAAQVLLLAFAGALVAVILRAATCWVRDHAKLSYGKAFALVLTLLVVVLVALGFYLVPRVDQQIGKLSEQLPQAVDQLDAQLEQYGWYQWVQGVAPDPQQMAENAGDGGGGGNGGGGLLRQVGSFLRVTLGGLVQLVVIFFVGLYLAAQPDLYRRGTLRLVPKSRRSNAASILDQVDHTLKWWLLGRVVSMTIIGIATTIGLMILGIPLALTMGLLAAVLTFIPNFGPILSAIPPMLLGMMESPRMALWVALLYLGIQTVESYLVTPLIQQRAVSLPPALILLAQILMGILFGFLGFALATPLTAVALVLVQRLYVDDLLHDDLDEPPAGSFAAEEGA